MTHCSALGCINPIRARHLCAMHYERRRRLNIEQGTPLTVDAQAIRDHLATLRQAGLTRQTISERSGVPRATIESIVQPNRYKTVTSTTANALLAVRPTRRHSGAAEIDATGTRRRLQALGAIGWSAASLAPHLGWSRQFVHKLLVSRRVEAATADRVARTFRDLYGTPGPSARAQAHATRKGWALPLEWDDIDDPNEQPTRARRTDAGQRGRALDRRESVAEWMDDRRPMSHKGSAQQIAEALGVHIRTIERDRAEITSERAKEAA